ncbi:MULTISPECIES: cytochrome c-type biogenesis protein [Thermus]|uniref:Cytochrome c-type biogenesis protein n=1 Tax=Thermus brockianus TaxID=56956 RepID=A0A1J0LTP9_THEBO|nr:cytochrome c-type biogenesis protein CcmH [Thermus brockianus]APD08815.1 cytochrome C biogenesis protein [Thermus brockianus]
MRWVLLALLLVPALGQAGPPPDLSPEVFRIARELRCPVCQGESAAESNSGVAVEMRRLIAEMLQEGKTEEEIKAFFVDRYGEWILYEPPRRGVTLWAWVLPGLALLLLGLGLFAYFRPKRVPQDLLEEAERRLKEPPA